MVSCFKGRTQSYNFVKQTSSRPDVRLLIILWFIYLFWTHIIRRSHICLCIFRFLGENSWQTKVSQFNIISYVEEDIAWLDISMENLSFRSVVTLIESLHYLSKNLPNHILCHKIFLLFTFLYQFSKITPSTVFHYYIKLAFLSFDYSIIFKKGFDNLLSVVFNNWWMVQLTYNIYFWN